MSLTLDSRLFITTFINNSSIVKSSYLDRTIKVIINKYRINIIKALDSAFIIDYLNKIRIIYFLKRLNYFNRAKALRLRGTFLL